MKPTHDEIQAAARVTLQRLLERRPSFRARLTPTLRAVLVDIERGDLRDLGSAREQGPARCKPLADKTAG